MRLRYSLSVALACVSACTSACTSGQRSSETRARAEAHLDEFETFERWALRTVGGAPAMDDAERIEAALFAPLRLDERIAGAWVTSDALPHDRLMFRLPAAVVSETPLETMRFDGETFQVGMLSDGATLIVRTRGTVTVAVAFRR